MLNIACFAVRHDVWWTYFVSRAHKKASIPFQSAVSAYPSSSLCTGDAAVSGTPPALRSNSPSNGA